jgi:hypothetical protein
MTKDDVICMASKAGLTVGTNMSGIGLVGSPADIGIAHITLDQMRHFADIVAAAEREACAQVCLMPVDEIQVTDDCSEYVYKDHLDCAEAIRARALHDMNQAAEKNGEEL